MKRRYATHRLASTLSIPLSQYVIWQGGAPGVPHDWAAPTNWVQGRVPSEGDIVIIPPVDHSEVLPPIIDRRVPNIGQLRIERGGFLAILRKGQVCIDGLGLDYGGLINHGTFVLSGELHILHPWDMSLINTGIFIHKGILVLDRWSWQTVHHAPGSRYLGQGLTEELVF